MCSVVVKERGHHNKLEVKIFICPDCKSEYTVSHGSNGTKKHGIRNRRKCQKCFTTHYEDEMKIKIQENNK